MKNNEEPLIHLDDFLDEKNRLNKKACDKPLRFDGQVVRQGRYGKGFVADAKTNYSPELLAALEAV